MQGLKFTLTLSINQILRVYNIILRIIHTIKFNSYLKINVKISFFLIKSMTFTVKYNFFIEKYKIKNKKLIEYKNKITHLHTCNKRKYMWWRTNASDKILKGNAFVVSK